MVQSISKTHTQANSAQYQQFREKRDQLLQLIENQRQLAQKLNLNSEGEILDRLAERVRADNFKVLVLGEFKRGKSTFINAMLGAEILPAYARPCTAIINEIKWGEKPRALLHHMPSETGEVATPLTVPVHELEEYVTIQDGVSESEAIRGNRYDKVELFWSLDLCRNGVEIIDSPGLNEHEIRQKVTMEYLSTVDAILFVLSCEMLGSQSELKVIDETLRLMGHDDIFFICNRFNMVRPKEREDIRRHALTKLAPRTKRGGDRVFFINALGALDGRIEEDLEAVQHSGLPLVEKELESFLTIDRGKVKILRPATELRHVIKKARKTIPEREAMLRTDVKTLEMKYEQAQEPLRQLELKRHQIVTRVANFRADVRQMVAHKSRAFYRNLCDDPINNHANLIDQWVQSYEIKEPLKFFSQDIFKLSQSIERVIQELVTHTTSQLETSFTQWQEKELQPLLSQQIQTLSAELDSKAQSFLSEVDAMRIQFTGISEQSFDVEVEQASPLSRILAAAGGYLLGDLVSAGMGAAFGLKEMLVNVLQQVVLAVVTILLVGLNPVVLIPVMLGGGFVHGLIKINATNDKIKKKFAEKFADQLRQSSAERSEEIANAVAEKLNDFQSAIDTGLGNELQGVRDQVNSILKEKQKGQANVDQKLRELEVMENQLNEIDDALNSLIDQIAM